MIQDGLLPLESLADGSGSKSLAGVETIYQLLRQGLLGELLGALTKRRPGTQGLVPVSSVRLQSPVLSPEKIFCAAVNYASHGHEQATKPPEAPYFFTKFRNTIVGPHDPILLPKASKKMDWEVELAAVIGKRGKYIAKREALEYVAGYTVANDVSFRDLLFHEALKIKPDVQGLNWVKGKSLDGALPLGPWLVTTDEIKSPRGLGISLSVNGKVKQKSSTSEMIFGVDDMVEYLSQGITLEPGDVITTGTPAGVAAFSGGPYLKEGDLVEAEIQGIGKLSNRVVAET